MVLKAKTNFDSVLSTKNENDIIRIIRMAMMYYTHSQSYAQRHNKIKNKISLLILSKIN